MRRRITLGGAILAAAFACAILGGVLWSKIAAGSQTLALSGTRVDSGPPAPAVVLTDQDGRPFRLTDERGKVVVLFFGYAHCPDICPTTLATLAQADRRLGASASDVAVVFVTVDPQRDSVAALRKYVALFDPRFVGVTGSQPALDAVYAAYHVWHQKLPNHGSAAGYLMAHSSAVYMLDRSGDLRVIHDWNDPPAVLAHDMKALL
jgi:protein SCO1/2